MPTASRAFRCTTHGPIAPKVSILEGQGLPGVDVFPPRQTTCRATPIASEVGEKTRVFGWAELSW